MDPITSLSVYSHTFDGTTNSVSFRFVKPAGDVGGYELFESSTGVVYTSHAIRIDASHNRAKEYSTTDSGGFTFFSTLIPDFGTHFYYYIKAISKTYISSIASNIVDLYTYPSSPSNCLAVYDGFQVDLTWDPINTSTGNAEFDHYDVRRRSVSEVIGFTFDTDTIKHADLVKEKYVIVVDFMKRCKWFGQITTEGEFVLSSTNKVIPASDISSLYTVIKDNLKVYIEGPSATTVTSTTNTFYTDLTAAFNEYYVYEIYSIGNGPKESLPCKYSVYTIDTVLSYPYLRSIGNSSTGLISQEEWQLIKAALVGDKYFNKTQYALPYAANTPYNLKGYLGVSKCNFDIFVNGIYSYTTSTGDYGEWEIDYVFPLGDTKLKFQARDRLNINFSTFSVNYTISTLNIYTFLNSLGNQYYKAKIDLTSVKTSNDITKATYADFQDRYSPFIEIYRQGSETEAKFIDIASTAFKAFEYVAYDESLYELLDVFQKEVTEFDHYEVYYNNSLYNTKKTGRSYVLNTSSGLARANYIYAISSVKFDGQESTPITLRLDRRWWPLTYLGFNILNWSQVNDIDFYRIYRAYTDTSTGAFHHVIDTSYLSFVDIGLNPPNPAVNPREYNFTDFDAPEFFDSYDDIHVTNTLMRLKKATEMVIILYAKENLSIPDSEITRLKLLCRKYIAPEIIYRILHVNNSTVTVLPIE